MIPSLLKLAINAPVKRLRGPEDLYDRVKDFMREIYPDKVAEAAAKSVRLNNGLSVYAMAEEIAVGMLRENVSASLEDFLKRLREARWPEWVGR